MITSLSIVFLSTCYIYFKQFYIKFFNENLDNEEQRKVWLNKLEKSLKLIPFAIGLIVLFYIITFTIDKLSPTTEDIRLIRHIGDIGTDVICLTLLYLDKLKFDQCKFIKDPGK